MCGSLQHRLLLSANITLTWLDCLKMLRFEFDWIANCHCPYLQLGKITFSEYAYTKRLTNPIKIPIP